MAESQNQKTAEEASGKQSTRAGLRLIDNIILPLWRPLWAALDRRARAYLGKFFRMFGTTVTDPRLIRDTHFVAWHEIVMQSGIKSPTGYVNTAVAKWNDVAPSFELMTLALLPSRDDRRREQVKKFDLGLKKEIGRFIARLPKTCGRDTRRLYRDRLLDAADVLAEQGKFPKSFCEVANEADLDAFVGAPRFGDIAEISVRRTEVLSSMRRLLDELYPDDPAGDEVDEMIAILPRRGLEMPVRIELKLANFDDETLYDELLLLCINAVEAFEQVPDPTSLGLAQAGIATLLILGYSATRAQVADAGFFGKTTSSVRGRRPRFILTLKGVKVDIDAEADLADLADLIDRYWHACSAHFHKPTYLFESTTSARRASQTIHTFVTALTITLGFTLSPSELRSLCLRQQIKAGKFKAEDISDFGRYGHVDNFRFRFKAIYREDAADQFARRIIPPDLGRQK